VIDFIARCTCSIPMHFRHNDLKSLSNIFKITSPQQAPRLDKESGREYDNVISKPTGLAMNYSPETALTARRARTLVDVERSQAFLFSKDTRRRLWLNLARKELSIF
jgi:hypothetical protein